MNVKLEWAVEPEEVRWGREWEGRKIECRRRVTQQEVGSVGRDG
jgi:hypothetical protein